MHFKIKPINIFLLIGIWSTFYSCTGQTNIKNGKIVDELPETIWTIYQDKNSNYWFGGNGDGVFFFDGKNIKQFTTENGLASNQIRGIQEDESGNIYFDTPNGVNKYDGFSFIKLNPVFSPQNKWMSTPGDLWFKCNGDINGVFRYDGNSLFHLPFPEYDLDELNIASFSRYGVYSIYQGTNGDLWFGTLSAGVYRYSNESQFWISEKELSVLDDGRVPGVRSIIEDKDGHFWLSNILHRYKIYQNNSGPANKNKYEKLKGIEPTAGEDYMEFPYFMSAVLDDENKDLWMLTYSQGVWRYEGHQLIHYPIKNGDQEVLLFSIYKDNAGVIWLGTHNAGVYRYNGTNFVKFEP